MAVNRFDLLNNRRLLAPIGNIPTSEAEEGNYAIPS